MLHELGDNMFRELGLGLCIWDVFSIIIVITIVVVLTVHWIHTSKYNQKLKDDIKELDNP